MVYFSVIAQFYVISSTSVGTYLCSLNLVRFCSDRILAVIGNRRSNLGKLRKGSLGEPERGTDACNESLSLALPSCIVYIIASSISDARMFRGKYFFALVLIFMRNILEFHSGF